MQGGRKLFYGGGRGGEGGGWVKMLATMVDRQQKLKKKTLVKTP